jgi:hypothetical protein
LWYVLCSGVNQFLYLYDFHWVWHLLELKELPLIQGSLFAGGLLHADYLWKSSSVHGALRGIRVSVFSGIRELSSSQPSVLAASVLGSDLSGIACSGPGRVLTFVFFIQGWDENTL